MTEEQSGKITKDADNRRGSMSMPRYESGTNSEGVTITQGKPRPKSQD